MTTIESTIRSMRATLPRHQRAYEGGYARHPALAPYTTPEATLTALAPGSELSEAQRGDIVAALVRAHQEAGGAVWQTILAVAFEPALRRVRGKLQRPRTEDLEQDVLLAFVTALGLPSMVTVGAFAPAALVREVERIALRRGRRLKKHDVRTEFDEERYDTESQAAADRRARERANAVIASASPEIRELLTATVAYAESITDYVARCLPHLDERQRACAVARLQRTRVRALLDLRDAELSPGTDDPPDAA